MNTTLLHKLCLPILFLLMLLTSCSQDDLDDLSDTLYVRHKGADMPAHLYGNASERVFLIILHGGPGGDGLVYRAGTIRSEIEKVCSVVYFDQRGSGMSQGNYSEEDISVDLMAEDVMALVKTIRYKYGDDSKFFLMGHSWGGTLGTAVLLENQDAFEGWIDVAGAHNAKGIYTEYPKNFRRVADEQIRLGNTVGYWEGVQEKINAIDTLRFEIDDFYTMNREAFVAEGKLEEDDVIKSIDNDILGELTVTGLFKNNPLTTVWSGAQTASILVDDQGIFENLSFSDRLNEITIPSLVLWGEHDMVVPPVYAEEAFNTFGSEVKELVIFQESGHGPMFTEPNLFANKVIAFIEQNK
ncbi:alpha/beta fold hydrolase [Maribacter sp. 2-571]|uniref:alpha/beta fold hydrolase n=1 Tax=Maribacter sp. 2-571 TaxID=3417569 RepID=UPI003D35039D